MKKLKSIIFKTVDDYRSVLPRVIVGLIFLSKGIQKLLFPELVGAGRFEKIGFAILSFWHHLSYRLKLFAACSY